LLDTLHSSVSGSLEAPVLVPIRSLLTADSPRLAGENIQHARLLAESGAPLPPILAHRATRRVIDGMHRLRAAMLRGEDRIAVQFFDGTEDAAFVVAVQANIAHGLPLSLADREAAATRIVSAYPQWSDRAIAKAAGLSAKTVSAIRRRTTEDSPQLHSRLGRDGRVRPLDGAVGRIRASEMITRRPDASLREIARAAGISTGTVRDVRDRLRRGDDPIPLKQRGIPRRPAPEQQRAAVTPRRDPAALLRNLRKDPSLRFTESGRALLRWLDMRAVGPDGWRQLLESIPPHCTYVVADLARGAAEDWRQFADRLKQRAEATV
jgi:hypothetical protein